MAITHFLEQTNDFQGKIFSDFVNENGFESDQEFTFKNCIFESDFVLEDLKINKIKFIKCTFKKLSEIKNCELRILEFDDCSFEDKFNLTSNNCVSASINLSGSELYINGSYQNLTIDTCILDKLKLKDVNTVYTPLDSIIEFRYNIVDKVDFLSTATYSNIVIDDGAYKHLYFNGEFNNSIKFEGNLNVENLFFEASTFKDRIDFESGLFKYIYWYRNNFNGLILINDFGVLDRIISRVIEIKELNFHSNIFENSVIVNVLNIKTLNISDNNFKQLFSFSNHFSKLETECIDINVDGTNVGNMVFENVHADFRNSSINFGNIYFKNVKFRHLVFADSQNNGVISFSNIVAVDLFVIEDSNVGNSEFLSTDFETFNEIVFANSNISNMSFSKFPFKIRSYTQNPVIGYGIKNRKDNHANLRSSYNQLKKIAITKGDIDTSNKYQSLEYKHLFRQKSFLNIDKILLGLNYLSNDNGYSWFRGVIFTMTIFVLSFYVFISCSGDSGTFSHFIFYMTSFPKLEISGDTYWKLELIKWFSRIFIGYGIYQTIAAFRKYGKGTKY